MIPWKYIGPGSSREDPYCDADIIADLNGEVVLSGHDVAIAMKHLETVVRAPELYNENERLRKQNAVFRSIIVEMQKLMLAQDKVTDDFFRARRDLFSVGELEGVDDSRG